MSILHDRWMLLLFCTTQPRDDQLNAHELALWFVDTDSIRVFNADSALQQDENQVGPLDLPLPELPRTSLQEQRRLLIELVGRMPELHYWDPEQPQLLAIEWSHCISHSTFDRRRIDSTYSLRSHRVLQVRKARCILWWGCYFYIFSLSVLFHVIV